MRLLSILPHSLSHTRARRSSTPFEGIPESAVEPAAVPDSMQSVRDTLRRADEALKKANQPVYKFGKFYSKLHTHKCTHYTYTDAYTHTGTNTKSCRSSCTIVTLFCEKGRK